MVTAQVDGDGTYVAVALDAPSLAGPTAPTNAPVVGFAVTFPIAVSGLAS